MYEAAHKGDYDKISEEIMKDKNVVLMQDDVKYKY